MTFNWGYIIFICQIKNQLIMRILFFIYGLIKSQLLTTATDNSSFDLFNKSRHPSTVGGAVTFGIKQRHEGEASAVNGEDSQHGVTGEVFQEQFSKRMPFDATDLINHRFFLLCMPI